MKNTSKSSKLLSFIMAFLILLVSLPTYALASLALEETSQGLKEAQTTALPEEEGVYVLEEDISLREENVKHFKLSNGTVKAVSYANAVHYLDAEGNWIDIDNSLTLNGSEYTANNKQEIKFANKTDSNGLLSIKDGEYKIDFTPLNTNKVSVEIENPQENNSRKFDDVKKLNNIVSRATYKGIYEGIDLEYILVGNNIKENIIVNKKQEEYTYSFEIKLSKLNATLENNMVVLTDSDTGEKVYEIPAPYMVDANGEYSDKVEYTLTKDSKWKYTFTVKADPEWINEEERQLPVKIDPTVIVNSNITDMNATFEYTKSSTGTVTSTTVDITDNGALIVGNFVNYLYDSIAFMKFNSLPVLPAGTKLMSANVEFYVYNYLNDTDLDGLNLGIYQAMAEWTYYTDRTISGNYSMFNDYCNTNSAVVSGTINGNGIYSFNITDLYSSWIYGTANNGFCLKGMNLPQNDNNSSTYEDLAAYIVASNGINGYVSPSLEVSYTHLIGVEDYYAYAENTLGDVGKSYVNLYNGSLTYVNHLTSVEVGPNLTYDIDMVYNSIEKTWRPSFAECIMPYDDDGSVLYEYTSTGERYGIERYLWRDPDGTLHAFTPHLEKNAYGAYLQSEYLPDGTTQGVIDPTVFYPEDDIDYVLIQTENNEFILRDYNGNQKMFDSQGRLSKICDAQGNVIYFEYADNRILSITKRTVDNKISNQKRMNYDSNGRLCCVYDTTSQKTTKIEYSTYEDPETSEIINEIIIRYANIILCIINDSDWNIKEVQLYSLGFYNGEFVNSQKREIYNHFDGKVINISQIDRYDSLYPDSSGNYPTINESVSKSFEIEYGLNKTSCKETIENIEKEYVHDYKGRIIEIYSCDGELNEEKTLIESSEYNDDIIPTNEYYSTTYSAKITQALMDSLGEYNIIRHNVPLDTSEFENFLITSSTEIQGIEPPSIDTNSKEESNSPYSIIYPDEREKVNNTTQYPYNAICHIESQYYAVKNNENGEIGTITIYATGFLVDSNVLITAGHVLYSDVSVTDDEGDYDDGIYNPRFPNKIIVSPGAYLNEDGILEKPYGSFVVETCYIQKEYFDTCNANYDWATCIINDNLILETGYFNLAIGNSNVLGDESIKIVGYPNDYGDMYISSGTILQTTDFVFFHNADTLNGNSGSPVLIDGNDNLVYGIHTFGTVNINISGNGGVLINEFIYSFVNYLKE